MRRALHILRRLGHSRHLTDLGIIKALKIDRDINLADCGTHYCTTTEMQYFLKRVMISAMGAIEQADDDSATAAAIHDIQQLALELLGSLPPALRLLGDAVHQALRRLRLAVQVVRDVLQRHAEQLLRTLGLFRHLRRLGLRLLHPREHPLRVPQHQMPGLAPDAVPVPVDVVALRPSPRPVEPLAERVFRRMPSSDLPHALPAVVDHHVAHVQLSTPRRLDPTWPI